MNSGFWLPIVCRIPSVTDTFDRFNSIVAERDAVDVEHDVRSLGVLPEHRDFFDHGEVVGVRVAPVDQPDRLGLLADTGLHLHAVTEQLVNVSVGLVEVMASTDRGSLAKLIEGPVDQVVVVAASLEILHQEDRSRRSSCPRGTPSCPDTRTRAAPGTA